MGAPARARLPNRRGCATVAVTYRGTEYPLSVGYDEDGRCKEVFVAGAKQGADVEFLVDDFCTVLSIAMQHGISAKASAGADG